MLGKLEKKHFEIRQLFDLNYTFDGLILRSWNDSLYFHHKPDESTGAYEYFIGMTKAFAKVQS